MSTIVLGGQQVLVVECKLCTAVFTNAQKLVRNMKSHVISELWPPSSCFSSFPGVWMMMKDFPRRDTYIANPFALRHTTAAHGWTETEAADPSRMRWFACSCPSCEGRRVDAATFFAHQDALEAKTPQVFCLEEARVRGRASEGARVQTMSVFFSCLLFFFRSRDPFRR